MNRTKIDWCDYTWNPVVGCLHGCPYCYARKIAERFKGGKAYPFGFEPTSHLSKRINEPMLVKQPSKIFVCSMADLFGDWSWKVPWNGGVVSGDAVINSVLEIVKKCPQHTFLFLTKNPKRYRRFNLPPNAWAGATVTVQDDLERIGYLPLEGNRFISIEPLLGEINFAKRPYRSAIPFVDWIIIGAQTGPGAVVPNQKWVQSIIDQARARGIPVFVKENVHWPEVIREFPEVRA